MNDGDDTVGAEGALMELTPESMPMFAEILASAGRAFYPGQGSGSWGPPDGSYLLILAWEPERARVLTDMLDSATEENPVNAALRAENAVLRSRLRFFEQASTPGYSVPSKPEPHVQSLTTLDRDDNPIWPTCTYCGKPAELCTGTKEGA